MAALLRATWPLRILLLWSTCSASAVATPSVAFPFNSQVPTVARVDQPYLFQFSESTFAPHSTNFTYSISAQPAWLSLDIVTRTLSGTPDGKDVGATTFTLTAADEAGAVHMPCTLVVSGDPAPQLQGDMAQQLAATANLSSSEPPVVTILPSAGFTFQFQQSSFIDIVQRQLYYYATLTDHTPLPSWLDFDASSLTFSGNAPLLSAFPQSWDVNLIASDVVGFAGATASFTISIDTRLLAFVPSQQTVNITEGERLDYTSLQTQLFQNGVAIQPSTLERAEVTPLPSWLSFDATTLALKGYVPGGVHTESISITVTDTHGDTATTVIDLVSGNATLFARNIGTLTAHAGEAFTYQLPDNLFTQTGMQITVVLPDTAKWLHYDSSSRTLQGTVPSETTPTTLSATLSAKSSALPSPQIQSFTIDIKTAAKGPDSASRPTTHTSPTASATSTPSLVTTVHESHWHLPGGVIAAIVVSSVLVAIMLIAFLIICLRRRRRRTDGYERHSASPVKKSLISRPIPPPDPEAITVTTELHRDVEKADDEGQAVYDGEPPPQIALNLPSRATSRKSRWLQRFSHISQASSIGDGEDAIKADTNIPYWGAESTALHTPHDSFSVPTEMARVSRHVSQSSPTKRAMRRLRERQQARQSVGLGIDTGEGPSLPRHSSRGSRYHRRKASSMGLSAAIDRSSQASGSTRGTSVLSTRPSDFPRPPTRSTLTMSIPALSITDADRHKSIRLVGRSDSIADNRSIEEKRQSFIRNRASTSLQSPLWAHASRTPSSNLQNGNVAVPASSAGSVRRARKGRSQLKSYSESSSLEPQRESKRLSARVKSAFAPNYPKAITEPRTIPQSREITQTSLGADDEGAADDPDSGWTTSTSGEDLAAQLALPRHQRSFVLPGEASPTPPPAPPTSRQASTARQSASPGDYVGPRQIWKERMKERSSSPLSTAIAVPIADRSSVSAPNRAARSRLSEPMSLVSNDSVSRPKLERPKLVHTNSKRPVSVEQVKRLSSLKAETGTETDTQAGSEIWEDIEHGTELEGSGLMPKAASESQANTQRSNVSGPAFL